MNQYLNTIKHSLNYKLSLSNIELYHSNLLSDVLEKFKNQPFTLLEGVVPNYKNFKITTVQREKKNRDLTISLTDNHRDITVIIENKFKSIPYKEQLEKYMTKDKNTYYILLSLTKPLANILPNGWIWKSYEELSWYYLSLIQTTDNLLYKKFLEDYVGYIKAVSSLLELDILDIDINNYYLNNYVQKQLTEVGLIDVVHKIRYANMKNKIDNQEVSTYFGRIRGAYYFGCTYKITDTVSFDIQIQNKQYRHKLNINKSVNSNLLELEKICSKLKQEKLLFNYSSDNGELFQSANRRKEWNKYDGRDSLDLYDYKNIKDNVKFDQLISYLNKDLSTLINNADKIKQAVLKE